jgi:hypothetical protein
MPASWQNIGGFASCDFQVVCHRAPPPTGAGLLFRAWPFRRAGASDITAFLVEEP